MQHDQYRSDHCFFATVPRNLNGHSKGNLWLFEGSSTKFFKLRIVLSINLVLISVSDHIRWSAAGGAHHLYISALARPRPGSLMSGQADLGRDLTKRHSQNSVYGTG
jgi:hypothetical protein